jgi:hypothetical protein
VNSDFATRVGTVCKPYADYASTSYLRLRGFNRYAPDTRLLPRVAAHLEKDRAYTDLRQELEALGDPPSGSATWATVLDGFRSTERDVKMEIASARSGDAARFTDLATRLEDDTTALRAHLGAAGLSDSPCMSAEGDPLKAPPSMG